MKITHLAAMSLVLLAAACGGENKEPATPATEAAPPPPPAPPAVPAEPAKPAEPPPPAKLEALTKPESTWTVGGKSASKVTGEEALAAAKKAGYIKGEATATPAVAGQYESVSFPIEKAKIKGTVKLVRPTATPGTDDKGASAPAKLGDALNKDTSAFYYDSDADVFVGVELSEGGKAADAKKALDAIAKPGKSKGPGPSNAGKDSNTVPPKSKGPSTDTKK